MVDLSSLSIVLNGNSNSSRLVVGSNDAHISNGAVPKRVVGGLGTISIIEIFTTANNSNATELANTISAEAEAKVNAGDVNRFELYINVERVICIRELDLNQLNLFVENSAAGLNDPSFQQLFTLLDMNSAAPLVVKILVPNGSKERVINAYNNAGLSQAMVNFGINLSEIVWERTLGGGFDTKYV